VNRKPREETELTFKQVNAKVTGKEISPKNKEGKKVPVVFGLNPKQE